MHVYCGQSQSAGTWTALTIQLDGSGVERVLWDGHQDAIAAISQDGIQHVPHGHAGTICEENALHAAPTALGRCRNLQCVLLGCLLREVRSHLGRAPLPREKDANAFRTLCNGLDTLYLCRCIFVYVKAHTSGEEGKPSRLSM